MKSIVAHPRTRQPFNFRRRRRRLDDANRGHFLHDPHWKPFIQAKPEREACYQRQAAELAAKRKPEPPRELEAMQSLERMKHEDEALNRQLHSICRGC